MTILALSVFESTMLRTAILLLLLFIVLWLMNRRYHTEEEKRGDRLQKQYATLTEDILAAIPDDEVVEAVVANLNAKQDPRRPDPYATIPLLSRGRTLVYSVWLIHKELDSGDFDTLLQSPALVFGEYAAEGLAQFGAPACAAAVQAGLAAESDVERADCHASYLEAADEEQPLTKCVEYIRLNPQEFVDEDAPAPADTPREE